MKKLFYAVTATLIVASAITSCKTTEANYRSAYEIAKAKADEGLTKEELDGFRREESTPKSVYKGDSIPMRGDFVNVVADKQGEKPRKVEKFNIVVASFKQLFNARSVRERLADAGWDSAAVLVDREDRYFVSAASTANLDTAVTLLRTLQSSSPLPLRPPFPYILNKAR